MPTGVYLSVIVILVEALADMRKLRTKPKLLRRTEYANGAKRDSG